MKKKLNGDQKFNLLVVSFVFTMLVVVAIVICISLFMLVGPPIIFAIIMFGAGWYSIYTFLLGRN